MCCVKLYHAREWRDRRFWKVGNEVKSWSSKTKGLFCEALYKQQKKNGLFCYVSRWRAEHAGICTPFTRRMTWRKSSARIISANFYYTGHEEKVGRARAFDGSGTRYFQVRTNASNVLQYRQYVFLCRWGSSHVGRMDMGKQALMSTDIAQRLPADSSFGARIFSHIRQKPGTISD